MKRFAPAAVFALLSGAMLAAPAQADDALAKKHNCFACHQVDKKVVGPSYKDVAAKYKGKDAVAQLAEKIKKGGAGAWGQIPMPPNPALSDADAQKLAKWVLSH